MQTKKISILMTISLIISMIPSPAYASSKNTPFEHDAIVSGLEQDLIDTDTETFEDDTDLLSENEDYAVLDDTNINFSNEIPNTESEDIKDISNSDIDENIESYSEESISPDGISLEDVPYYEDCKIHVMEGKTYDLLYREKPDGTISISTIMGQASGDLIIPEKINGKIVTEIETGAFDFVLNAQPLLYTGGNFTGKLILPNSITTIGHAAFSNTEFTGQLKLPKNLTVIGDGAFLECDGFTGKLVIPENVTKIGNNAFGCCRGITSLVLPKNLEILDTSAFDNCISLKGKLNLPPNLKYIGHSAFCYCISLDGNLVIPPNVTYIGDWAFSGCKFTGDLTIPKNVTSIGYSTFAGCPFGGKLSLSNGLKAIDQAAFSECRFNGDLAIPDSVETIGPYAFAKCYNYGTLTLPKKVKSIGEYAFYDCAFSGDLVIPNGITTIPEKVFEGGYYDSITIPETVTSIHDDAITANAKKLINKSNCKINNIGQIFDRYGEFYGLTNQETGEKIVPPTKTIGKGTFILSPLFIEEISFDRKSKTLGRGGKLKLNVTISPEDAYYNTIAWKSSKPKVASVDNKGVVKGLSNGTATITASTSYGPKATCKITVNDSIVEIKSLKLNKSKATITKGKTLTLKPTISPSNATDKTLKWSSSDKSIATVSQKGKVKALKKGKVTITATASNGKKATCKITVKNPVKVKSIKLNKTKAKLKVGKTLKLSVTFNPAKPTNTGITWKSSNKSVATVKNGKVKALKKGKATITAISKDGKKKAKCVVTVK